MVAAAWHGWVSEPAEALGDLAFREPHEVPQDDDAALAVAQGRESPDELVAIAPPIRYAVRVLLPTSPDQVSSPAACGMPGGSGGC